MDNTRAVVLLVIFLFVIFSPSYTPPPVLHFENREDVAKEAKRAFGVLLQSEYGDLAGRDNNWLNLTGFREADGYAWELLPRVKQRALQQAEDLLGDYRGILNGDSKSLLSPPKEPSNVAATHDLFRPSLYQNITGSVDGEWVRSNLAKDLQHPRLNLSALVPNRQFTSLECDRNVTGDEGRIHISFNERSSLSFRANGSDVRQVTSQIVLFDDSSSGEGWEINLYGVHYPASGSVVLSTTSPKFWSSYAAPQLALTKHAFNLSKTAFHKFVSDAIEEDDVPEFGGRRVPWYPSPRDMDRVLPITPHCEYVAYVQQHLLPISSVEAVEIIENELRFPSRFATGSPPEMAFSVVIFSPDCGFVLESKGPPLQFVGESNHLRGSKVEAIYTTSRLYSLLFSGVFALQTLLLIRQMNEASTPSTTSRISFFTIVVMSSGDCFAFAGFLLVGKLEEPAFLSLAITSFFAFMCFCIFGLRFLVLIWSTQAPEREDRSIPITNVRTPPPARNIPGLEDTLPLPVTTPRPQQPPELTILPPDQDLDAAAADDAAASTAVTNPQRAESAIALPARLYLSQLFLVFLTLAASGWPVVYRSLYLHTLFFMYGSMWVPQIYRNVVRNCRKALRYEFAIGEAILRIGPVVWLYTQPYNILSLPPSYNAALILGGWVWTQIWILIGQDVLGARFFVPRGWAPPAYDYHPVLGEDVESGMPIGFSQAVEDDTGSPSVSLHAEKRMGKKVYDCAICMQVIDLPSLASSSSRDDEPRQKETATELGQSFLARRAYMVTPCRHVFHTPCLEGWMKYRLQCPICRDVLPPL